MTTYFLPRHPTLLRWAALVLLVTTVTTVGVDPARGADGPAGHGMMGVVGCSNTHQHAGGYEDLSSRDLMWSRSAIRAYSGGTLAEWAGDTDSRWWQTFDGALAEFGADAVWVQLCIRARSASSTGMTATQQDQLVELLGRIQARVPGAPIYVSPLNGFTEGDCDALGEFGQPNSVELADWAAAEGLALRGPDTGPLDHSQLRTDHCHPNSAGEAIVGQQLVDFFDNEPPTVSLVAPTEGTTVTGSVTLAAEAADDHAVAGVVFSVSGMWLGTDLEPPYEATWDTSSGYDGVFVLKAAAVDDAGKTGEDAITVQVENGIVNTSPTASIAGDGEPAARVGRPLTLDGSPSGDAEGAIVGYQWDFGDGAAAHGPLVTHTYVSPGTFTASLTVTDDGGLTDTTSVAVTVEPDEPPAVLVASPAPLTAVSGTVAIEAEATDDGEIALVEFSVNGVPLGSDHDAPYQALWDTTLDYDGIHAVTAVAVDDLGQRAEDTVEVSVENGNVNTPPIAAIAGEATIPAAAGEPVSLDATPSHDAEGAIVSYVWDFGDGASGVGAAVTHPYLSAGTYEATVTVADDGGLTSAATVTVVITGDIEIEVLVDSFENGEWNGLWTEDPQDAWSITTNRATDGVAAAMIGPAASAATLTSGSLETHGATTASVTLAWYLRERAATGDRLALEYSTDGGGTWTPAAALESGVDALGVWHEVAVVVPCAPVLQIRLSATIQGSRIFGLVDNVLVTVGGAVEEISADPSAEIGATEEDTRMRPR